MKWLNKIFLKVAINKLINYLNSSKMKSVKTTILGVLGGLAMIFPQIINVLDNDPLTTLSIEVIIAGLSMMGFGWFARDKDVTDEQQGLR